MSPQIDYYRQLAGIMYRTRGCRFGAASSMEVKERWSIGTVAFLSVYLLAWSIFSMAFPEVITTKHATFYAAISAVASVALLVVSLLDYAFRRPVQAEKLQQNALQISVCMRELERELAETNPNVVTLAEIAATYERHISETQVNHTSMDYAHWLYASARPSGFFSSLWFPVRRLLFNCWFYLSSMFMYVFLLGAIIAPTVWYTVHFVIPPGFVK
jgi:SMODS and SLOG-associating 2TM effector domain family 5